MRYEIFCTRYFIPSFYVQLLGKFGMGAFFPEELFQFGQRTLNKRLMGNRNYH